MIAAAVAGAPEHRQGRHDARQQAVHRPQDQLLADQLAHRMTVHVPKCHSAQGDCQRLTSSVATLARKNGQESRQYDDLGDGAFKQTDHEPAAKAVNRLNCSQG